MVILGFIPDFSRNGLTITIRLKIGFCSEIHFLIISKIYLDNLIMGSLNMFICFIWMRIWVVILIYKYVNLAWGGEDDIVGRH